MLDLATATTFLDTLNSAHTSVMEVEKPQIVNQQHVLYHFQCNLCDAWTLAHMCKQKASSVYEHDHEQHGEVPEDLLRHFSILKK